MAENELCNMVAVYHLRLQVTNSFFGKLAIRCDRFCGFGSANNYKSLRMMLDILLLSYLFCKKDQLAFILGSVMT